MVSTEPGLPQGTMQAQGGFLDLLRNFPLWNKTGDIELPAEGPRDPRTMPGLVRNALEANTQVLDPIGGLRKALGK